MFSGKRELLSSFFSRSGITLLLSRLWERESLLVLTYHRIGSPEDDIFDPGIFSVTGEMFDEQVSHLKRHASVVNLEEALSCIEEKGTQKPGRCRVLITFDDGYLDNYKIAFPILRSHGIQGLFFLATGIVGSCEVPWWDHIAYVLRTAQNRRFTLEYPAELAIDLDQNGTDRSIQETLALYYRTENTDSKRFIHQLENAAAGRRPPSTERRFLGWDEAREMVQGGMAIGSHTHSHRILSQLGEEQQRYELEQSRLILRERLGVCIDTLAYPVGNPFSFSARTQGLARDAGYRAAFSFGGVPNTAKIARYNVSRVAMGGQSLPRFQLQVAACRFSGAFWP